jgi:hypothetical protein
MGGILSGGPETNASEGLSVGRRVLGILAMLVPACLSLYLFFFPILVMLERDLQLNGKTTTGCIVAYKLTYTKRRDPIHNYRVRFNVGSRTYFVWVDSASNPVKKGDIEVVYAPAFPKYAKVAGKRWDPWNQNLLLRSLAALFISSVSGVMTWGVFRRYIRPGKGRKPSIKGPVGLPSE